VASALLGRLIAPAVEALLDRIGRGFNRGAAGAGRSAAYVARVDAAAAAPVGARLQLAEDADRVRGSARLAGPPAP